LYANELKTLSSPFIHNFDSPQALDYFVMTSSNPDGRIVFHDDTSYLIGSSALIMDMNSIYSNNKNTITFGIEINNEYNQLLIEWMDLGDEYHEQDGIYISINNGISYTKVYIFDTENIEDYTWQNATIDLETYSQYKNVIIQIIQYDNSAAPSDGIAIRSISTHKSKVVFDASFEEGISDFRFYSQENGKIALYTNDDNTYISLTQTVTQKENILNKIQKKVPIDKNKTYNLTFEWLDIAEETHIQDGVFISFNDGKSFEQILHLKSSTNPNYTWKNESLFFTAMSNNLLIEFRQYDNCAAPEDGLAFDNIRLSETISNAIESNTSVLISAIESTFDYYIHNNKIILNATKPNNKAYFLKDQRGVVIASIDGQAEYVSYIIPNNILLPLYQEEILTANKK